MVDGWVYIGQALERGDLHQMGVLKRWGNEDKGLHLMVTTSSHFNTLFSFLENDIELPISLCRSFRPLVQRISVPPGCNPSS
jgi:hypothetical protein